MTPRLGEPVQTGVREAELGQQALRVQNCRLVWSQRPLTSETLLVVMSWRWDRRDEQMLLFCCSLNLQLGHS